MSSRHQSVFLHFDRTLNARTPHMVAASSRKPAIKQHNHWSGPCERGRARQCMMKCSGFFRSCLDSAAQCKTKCYLKRAVQNPTSFSEGCNNDNNAIYVMCVYPCVCMNVYIYIYIYVYTLNDNVITIVIAIDIYERSRSECPRCSPSSIDIDILIVLYLD